MAYETPLGGLWGIATIVGPILFVVVLAWAVFRNRTSSPREDRIAEQSAHDLRDELTAERKADEREVNAPR